MVGTESAKTMVFGWQRKRRKWLEICLSVLLISLVASTAAVEEVTRKQLDSLRESEDYVVVFWRKWAIRLCPSKRQDPGFIRGEIRLSVSDERHFFVKFESWTRARTRARLSKEWHHIRNLWSYFILKLFLLFYLETLYLRHAFRPWYVDVSGTDFRGSSPVSI